MQASSYVNLMAIWQDVISKPHGDLTECDIQTEVCNCVRTTGKEEIRKGKFSYVYVINYGLERFRRGVLS